MNLSNHITPTLSQTEVVRGIRESQQRMIQALEKVWYSAPNNPLIREKITEIIQKTAIINKAIDNLLK